MQITVGDYVYLKLQPYKRHTLANYFYHKLEAGGPFQSL